MRITCVQGDLTTQRVDAVVNAANSGLLGGGGVDGAIHRAAGPSLLAECRQVRAGVWPDGLPVGEAVATGAGDLAARWVIHTVGPDRHAGQTDPALLTSCFVRSLEVAGEVGARTVAFPAVSAGIYGWDPAQVADVAVAAVRDRGPSVPGLEEVRFVLLGEPVLGEFRRALASAGQPKRPEM
ncbi:O-acetyl-ADP-ribose deacetylase [Ornithinimicrobium sp. W1679]|uniref:O-acetyl-ADP-ribose deacetylase n=1 Tax=Ornithinimicrobium sp. W1679 TaxID=3418770 RepID=UPI003CF6729E